VRLVAEIEPRQEVRAEHECFGLQCDVARDGKLEAKADHGQPAVDLELRSHVMLALVARELCVARRVGVRDAGGGDEAEHDHSHAGIVSAACGLV
jgi:hypothetical protein